MTRSEWNNRRRPSSKPVSEAEISFNNEVIRRKDAGESDQKIMADMRIQPSILRRILEGSQ